MNSVLFLQLYGLLFVNFYSKSKVISKSKERTTIIKDSIKRAKGILREKFAIVFGENALIYKLYQELLQSQKNYTPDHSFIKSYVGFRYQLRSIYVEKDILPTLPYWHKQHKHLVELFGCFRQEIHLVLPFKGKPRPDNLKYRNKSSWKKHNWDEKHKQHSNR